MDHPDLTVSTGLKFLGRVGKHIFLIFFFFFSKMHKITLFTDNLKKSRFQQKIHLGRVGLP